MSTADSPERGVASLPGAPPRILVIQAPYYRAVVDGMRAGAEAVLKPLKAEVEIAEVAGAFELPAALRLALKAHHRWDGFLILGCVVKGETDHYDHICREACAGIMQIAAATGAAIGFGLLTVHTLRQAEERAAPGRMNKGAEAAHAMLGQIALARRWGLG
ncbi:MAG TPA: 6,7-dimethyl-8-ribityllumazine synthase [Acetobacteraceae bacterium]|nr:6,7-dimethyl-8-ribityllumazine synthase [Acetobacteraceae bacterium]